MNRGMIGWVVAGVLALALIGVVVFQVAGDDGSRTAALLPGGGLAPPPDIAGDVRQILEAKRTQGERALPQVGAGDQPTVLENNPEHACDPNLPPNVFAMWRHQPATLAEAGRTADQIVVATVEDVSDGDPLVAEAEAEPGGEVQTPVQHVTIRVEEVVKGSAQVGSQLTIGRLGDSAGCFRVHGDPAYRQGERHLLLLENAREGRQALQPLGASGRFLVARDQLRAVDELPFLNEIANQRLDQVIAKLRGR